MVESVGLGGVIVTTLLTFSIIVIFMRAVYRRGHNKGYTKGAEEVLEAWKDSLEDMKGDN